LLEGISDLTANYIHSGLQDTSLADQLLVKGVRIIYRGEKKPTTQKRRSGGLDQFINTGDVTPASSENQKPLRTVYVTGKVSGMSKRDLKEFVGQFGYEWASLSKKLDLLVIGENPGTAKLEKAKKYGLTIITWDEFRKELS
ncbi:MAG: BRCT domain-containing protein, partial [Promethearchaeota archaeon]